MRKELKGYLKRQQMRIRKLSCIDGSNSRVIHPHNKPSDQFQPPNREFQVPTIKEIFRNQATERLRHQNKIVRARLQQDMKSLESFLIQSKMTPKKKNKMEDSFYEDPRDKWTKNVLQNITKDRKQMIDSIQSIDCSPTQVADQPVSSSMRASTLRTVLRHKSPRLSEHERSTDMTTIKDTVYQQINSFKTISIDKQKELNKLLGSYNSNLIQNISDKRMAYKEGSISPAKLQTIRRKMSKKLSNRLELIKHQSQRFYKAMLDLKERMMILPEEILVFLQRVRQLLLAGKVLRQSEIEPLVRNLCPCAELRTTLECLDQATIE